MNSSTKKADKPKMTVKNGKVYGDALSAEEKKKIVMQKKKDKKAKKVRKSAQQTIPYVEMCRDVPLFLFLGIQLRQSLFFQAFAQHNQRGDVGKRKTSRL